MMANSSLKIDGLVLIEPQIFRDHRGENVETFNQKLMSDVLDSVLLPSLTFPVDSFSFSKKGVLRGFHGDHITWKLVQCLQGVIQLVVIDVRPNSVTKGNVQYFRLDDKTRTQVLIPKGCVNAHLCISKTCIFGYKLSNHYVPQKEQIHIKWNDPKYNVEWPVKKPILSARDR